MGLLGNRAVAHCSGSKPLNNLRNRLNFFDWNSRSNVGLEFEQTPERHQALCLVVHGVRVLLEDVIPL